MKSNLFITVLCLLLFAALGQAQQEAAIISLDQMLRSPMGQQMAKDELKQEIRLYWGGASEFSLTLLHDPKIRTAWGVSDELHQRIHGAVITSLNEIENHPEMQRLIKEMETLQDGNNLFSLNVDEKIQKKLAGVIEQMNTLATDLSNDTIRATLPPELKQKVQETLLASMPEMPIISLYAFEALNLTDTQKQRMKEIKKEFTPEFEKILEQYGQAHITLTNKFLAACDKQSGDASNTLEGIKAKLVAEDPEYKKIQDATIAKTQAFMIQFKTKVFDVLTDEQWKQLQELIDNPSEPAKIFREQWRKERSERKQAAPWLSDVDLWQPGGAIPEGYRQERNTKSRFPRGEN